MSKYKNKKIIIATSSLLVILLVSISVFFTFAFQADQTETVTNEFIPKEVVIDIVEKFDYAIKEDVNIENVGDTDAYIRFKIAISAIDADGNTVALPISVIEDNERTFRGITIDDFTITDKANTPWTEDFLAIDGIYYCKDLVPVTKSVHLFDKAVFNVDMLENEFALPITDAEGQSYYIIETDADGNRQLKSKEDEDGNLIPYVEGDLSANQTLLTDPVTYMSKNYTPVLTIVAESIQENGVEEAWPVTLDKENHTISPRATALVIE